MKRWFYLCLVCTLPPATVSCLLYLSLDQLQEVEEEMKSRQKLLEAQCTKYWPQLSNTTTRYLTRQRFDLMHRVMYCENYKVGSSTWASHFLHMNNITLPSKTPVHSWVKQNFPPMKGTHRNIR